MADYRAVEDGNTPQSSRLYKILTIVFGVCALGFLIGLIAVAASSGGKCEASHSSSHPAPAPANSSSASSSSEIPEKPYVFTEYTAETVVFFADYFESHETADIGHKRYVFGPNKFAQEFHFINSTSISRSIVDREKYPNATIVCNDLITHKNCYKTTDVSSRLTIYVEGDLYAQNVSCHNIIPYFKKFAPERNVTTCDYYVSTNLDLSIIVMIVVESETNYPLSLVFKDGKEKTYTEVLYSSFKPGKPEDESVLEPFPGVPIYDFTDGSGADNSKFQTKNYANIDMYKASIVKSDNLPMHSAPFPATGDFRIRNTVVRDVNDIPEQFDARTKWPECSDIIGTITNQLSCGCCWAMASSSVLSDRVCIATGVKQRLSPQYMVSCGRFTDGCRGGNFISTWQQLIYQGTVPESCVPFNGNDGSCPYQCYDGSNITAVKVYAKEIVSPWGNTSESRVQAIQSEIMTNGPVEASYLFFDDFSYYSGGIYRHSKTSKRTGGHAVRIIGWGTTEDHEDYWLVANSWGPDWGENGLFRIARGSNECNIEEQIFAGLVN